MSAPVWRPILEITRRELGAWSRSRWGWGLVSGALLLEGLLFNSFALGQTPRYSQQVLADLLYLAFGVHAVLAILVTMRAFPEERQRGTWALLAGSPARAWQIVAGKFAAAAALLLATGLGSLYLPALILVEGHITPGHLAVGYGGVWLASSAVAALGIFGAAAARTQLGAAALTSALLVGLLTSWLLAQITGPAAGRGAGASELLRRALSRVHAGAAAAPGRGLLRQRGGHRAGGGDPARGRPEVDMRSPPWSTWWMGAGLLGLMLEARVLALEGPARLAALALLGAAVAAAPLARARRWRGTEEVGLRRAHGLAGLASGGVALAVGLYLLGELGAAPTGAALTGAWATLLVVSLVPLIALELALASAGSMLHPEQVRQIGGRALAAAAALALVAPTNWLAARHDRVLELGWAQHPARRGGDPGASRGAGRSAARVCVLGADEPGAPAGALVSGAAARPRASSSRCSTSWPSQRRLAGSRCATTGCWRWSCPTGAPDTSSSVAPNAPGRPTCAIWTVTSSGRCARWRALAAPSS